MSKSLMISVFLSHSDKDKKVAANLKSMLLQHKIKVFIAHEDIDGGTEWMGTLYKEIQNSDVFFMLLSKNYHASTYTDQETGMALNLRKPILPICIDKTRPYGFISKYQAIICKYPFEKEKIIKIIGSTKKFTGEFSSTEPLILDELTKRLRNAGSYSEAASLANMIFKYKQFSSKQINRIAKAYTSNPEIFNSFIAKPLLSQILQSNMDKINSSFKSNLIGNSLF